MKKKMREEVLEKAFISGDEKKGNKVEEEDGTEKDEVEMQALQDTVDTTNSGMTFNEEVELMKKENIKNLSK